MTLNPVGIHWSNNGNPRDPWSHLWHYIVLLHLQLGDLAELRRRFKDAIIEVRFYLTDWYKTDPVEWANFIVKTFREQIQQHTLHIVCANEPELVYESSHPGAATASRVVPSKQLYLDFLAWYTTVFDIVSRECPNAIIHFPGSSLGHSNDQEDVEPSTGQRSGYVGMELWRNLILRHKAFDLHVYFEQAKSMGKDSIWFGKRELLPIRRIQRWGGKLDFYISEWGYNQARGDPNAAAVCSAWLRDLPSEIKGAAWFIWYSYDGFASRFLYDNPNGVLAAMDQFTPLDAPARQPLTPPENPDLYILSDDQIAELVSHWKFAQRDIAGAIILAESGGKIYAVNNDEPDGLPSAGLWQEHLIPGRNLTAAQAFDVEESTRFAFGLSSGGRDWHDWGAFTSGNYRAFLPRIQAALKRYDDKNGHAQVVVAAIQADVRARPEMPVNDQAWLVKYIVEHKLGFPETPEREITIDGTVYLYMTTTIAYVWMRQGDNASATHTFKASVKRSLWQRVRAALGLREANP